MCKRLEFYTEHFTTVEVNATFYRLFSPKTAENWYEKTPSEFLWSVKASRYITHIKRLKDFREPLKRFMDSMAPLKGKLCVVLFQLSPNLFFDRDVFEKFCKGLKEDCRYTIEAWHPSWLGEDALSMLRQHHIAWCISDTAGKYPYLEAFTSDFIYVRLHGSQKIYASEYTEDELRDWAAKIKKWGRDTYVYFDNDFKGYAPRNALRLKELLNQR
jgi:uncharacterized protein YecE (DUF72 family)